jgi:hypothetical protein
MDLTPSQNSRLALVMKSGKGKEPATSPWDTDGRKLIYCSHPRLQVNIEGPKERQGEAGYHCRQYPTVAKV